jgi:hypothetical protein
VPSLRTIGGASWLSIALVLAMSWFYFWTAAPEWQPELIARQDDGYYNLLARGFLRGHLSLDAKADPYLATLKNPWDPGQRGDHGLPDASYFHGRYYLYHGVSPEILLFLPFRILTGRFVSQTLACPIFATCGLMVSAWLLLAVQRRYFPRAPAPLILASIVAAGLANMMVVLLRRPSFREVPITCGYACCMVALAAIFQALHRRRSACWLAIAGTALGLAVGSRPLYLLACPVVFLPVWWDARARRLGRACWRDREWRTLVGAAVLPLLLVGLGLALYNYLRFGNPVEFGLRYQFWFEDPAKTQRFAWSFFVYNLRTYWLAPAEWSRYFPFVTFIKLPPQPAGFYGAEDPYGILPNLPFALFALGSPALLGAGRPDAGGRLRVFSLSVAFTAASMSVVMAFFQASLNRYMVDFLPAVVLLACLGLFAVSARPWCRGTSAAALTFTACLLSGYSAGFGVLASLRHNELFRAEHPVLYGRMAHRWNWLSYAYDRWHRTEYGPLEMKVIFPVDRIGTVEPLVATGHSFLSDYLYVHYLGPDSIQFGLEHTSRAGLLGRPVPAAPGQVHELRIDLGSLYPPADHPYFDSMPVTEARQRQNTVRVILDGDVVLDGLLPCYEANGAAPSLGSAGDRSGFGRPFSGQILAWRRRPDAIMDLRGNGYGALRLKLIVPPFTGSRSEPLVCTGETGRGDLVYVRYESATRVSFGYDHWGVGGFVSAPCPIDPAAVQSIEIDFGALHPAAPGPPTSEGKRGIPGWVRLSLNGQIVLDREALYYASKPATIAENPIGASTATRAFTGEIVRVERRP